MSAATPPGLARSPAAPAPPLTLPEFVADLAVRYTDRTALVTPYGRWSFAELAASVRRDAHRLRERGLRPGDRIAVMAPNGQPWVAAVLGASAAGAVPVLLHVLLTPDDVDTAITLTGCRFLLVGRRAGTKELLPGFVARHGEIAAAAIAAGDEHEPGDAFAALFELDPDGHVVAVSPWSDDEPDARSSGDPLPAVGPDDDALIMFTSGTSGTPKAVLHRHRAPCVQLRTWVDALALDGDDVLFTAYPFCWSSGFIRSLGSALSVGATLVTVDHLRAEQALAMIEHERCTKIAMPGAHLDQRLASSPGFAGHDLSSVRAATPTLAGALGIPSLGFVGYGMTETFTLVTAARTEDSDIEDPRWVGKALPGWHVRVVDFDAGSPIDAGTTGRIEVSGPGMMRGYLNRDRADYMTADGWFRTPDAGFLDRDGNLYFVGRTDDIVRTAGVNVSTIEVEQVLATHPAVNLAVAFGVPHPELDQALVACVVPKAGDFDEQEILAWLEQRLARYKLPRRVIAFDEAELTFTASEKVQRSQLRALVTARMADGRAW